ncbi:cohesin domain-containing protein, partial [Clostridium perfringens]|uniref:cohesin domain-containing protein n=1 Tax=Clostridium perfringens TaxID=1502 RepID=UPI002ACC219B
MVIAPVKTFAASNASVEVNVSGEVKKGSNIEILVDVMNVDNLYAASIDFTYNTNQLEVESIKPTEYITINIDNIMELGGETNKNGDTATYSFTFLGDVDVLMESGTLVKINAKVLNNDKLSITKENMKIKLIQKADGTVKNY